VLQLAPDLRSLQSGAGRMIRAQEDWVTEAQYTSKDFQTASTLALHNQALDKDYRIVRVATVGA
jgi:hypothetical protein